MKTICIVPCGVKKIWDKYPDAGPTPAKDVYIGVFARKCQEYAQAFYPDSYYILSAKYGFLHPLDIIQENYNVTFKESKTNPVMICELVKIAKRKDLYNVDRVIVVAGKDYFHIVKSVFSEKEIVDPLKVCKGNGFMMQKINDAIRSATELR